MSPHQSLRCTICNIHWPLYDEAGNRSAEFAACPKCGDETWGSTGLPGMSWAEAKSDKAHLDFERFLEEREQRDRKLMERTEPFAFAQYLMDSAEEQIEHEAATLRDP